MTWKSASVDKDTLRGRIGMLVHNDYLMDPRVRREAESLADAGYEVHVVSSRQSSNHGKSSDPSREKVNGVHIHRVPLTKRRGNKFRYLYEFASMTILGAWKLALLHFRHKFDVVHIHNMPDLLIFAGLIPKWTGAALVLDVHDPMTELFQASYKLNGSVFFIRLIKIQEWLCYRLAEHLITVSIPMAENVAKKRGCPKESIHVIHNYPDLRSFPVQENNHRWPPNGDSVVFLYSGTVTDHYRVDIAVKALARVADTMPKIKFRILGDGNRIQEVLDSARDHGIGDKVEHLKPVAIEKVKDIMAGAAVGISTHQAGIFGDLYFSNKIVEFMTQGIPVICSRTHTIEEYIPENAIFYFEPLQVDDLAVKILEMFQNPDRVADRIKNSQGLLSRFDWQAEREKFIQLYGTLIRGKGLEGSL